MPALFACKPLTATRPSHALAVAKQMLRSPASLEAEWVDETEPFSELVGSPLSDGGPTVVFGVCCAIGGLSSCDQSQVGSINPAYFVQSLKPPM